MVDLFDSAITRRTSWRSKFLETSRTVLSIAASAALLGMHHSKPTAVEIGSPRVVCAGGGANHSSILIRLTPIHGLERTSRLALNADATKFYVVETKHETKLTFNVDQSMLR